MFRSILNFILSPLTSAIYNIFVLGPLKFFNLLNRCFDFLIGSSVTDLLFKTTFVDGKPQLNFFQSNSPLRPMFMTMLGIGVVLIICFSGISIASSLTNFQNKKWMKKMRNVVSSTTGIFLVPLVFLTVLSLSGTLLNVINGKRVEMSNNDQIVYNTNTKKQLVKVKKAQENLLLNLRGDQMIFNVFAEQENKKNDNQENFSLTIDQIYQNILSEESGLDENNSIVINASQSRNTFLNIKNLIQSQDFTNSINNVLKIINQLKPNIKNEKFAENIKNASHYFFNINSNIDKFIEIGNEINKNIVEYPKSYEEKSVFNYKQFFDYVVGQNNQIIYQKNSNVSNFLDMKEEINALVNGTLSSPNSGLFYLRQQLSDIKENDLVVNLYQLATNKNDRNWENPKWIWGLPPNLFVGGIIIYIAIVLMCLNIIFAIIRILNLAMLFVISPTIVMASSIDNGVIFKGWLKIVLKNIFSIFGMVLILQLFSTLFTSFDDLTKSSRAISSGINAPIRNILMCLFGIGGLLASRKGAKQIDKMLGNNRSFFGTFDGTNILRIFKNATNTFSRRRSISMNSSSEFLNKNQINKYSNSFDKFERNYKNTMERSSQVIGSKTKDWNGWKKAIISRRNKKNE